MADPVSIIGTVGALANIIQLVSQTITGIRDLQSDWKDANLSFLSLLGQLSTLRVALMKIDAWMKSDLGDAHHQLVLDLDATVDCCGILLTNLQGSVEKMQQRQDHTLDFQSKVRLMFGKKGINDIQRLLEHQTNALTLLLAACNCKTSTEQNALLVRSSSRKTLRQLNNDSASLFVHRDSASIATQTTDGLSKLSLAFSFDQEVFHSSVYERFFRGFAKKALSHPRRHHNAATEQAQTTHSFSHSVRHHVHKVLLFSYSYSRIDDFLHQMLPPEDTGCTGISLILERTAVYRYLIIYVKRLVLGLKTSGFKFSLETNSANGDFLLSYVHDINPVRPLDVRVADAIKSLWRDPALQSAKVKRPVIPLIYLLRDIDRITATDYIPTAVDLDAVGDTLPVVMQLRVIHQRTNRETQLLESQLIDVTLRFVTPDITSRFSARVDYDFTGISNIFLLAEGKGARVGSDPEPLFKEWIECAHSILWTTQASWFPRDKRLIVVFQNLSVHREQGSVNPAFLDDHLAELFRSWIHFSSLLVLLHPCIQTDNYWGERGLIELLQLQLEFFSATLVSEGIRRRIPRPQSDYRTI